jgi:hypothetical protein
VSSSPGRLFRYTYDPGARSYTLDPGFPVDIDKVDSETLVIAKDSTGMLWATWTAGNQVWVNHSLPGDDAHWATPYVMPGSGSTVTPDDISSIIAFGGNKIGLMWSNQVDGHFYFAIHTDGAAPTASAWSASVIPNTLSSDDHINLKTDSSGRVYAAVKHSTTGSNDPYLSLLVRSATGSWSRYTVARVKEGVTRPNVVIDEQSGVIHVVYTGPPLSDGTRQILEKTSSLSAISFTASAGTPLMRAGGGADFNDVTTAKQNIDSHTGMVVLASDAFANLYWHYDSLAPSSLITDRAPLDPPLIAPPPPPPPPGGSGQSIHLGDGTTQGADDQHSGAGHSRRPGSQPAVAATSGLTVAAVQRGASVRGTLAIRRARTHVRFLLRARQGHTTRSILVGSAIRDAARVGRLRFAIALSRRAQLALRRLGRIQVTLVVTCAAPGRHSVTVTRSVVLRRA